MIPFAVFNLIRLITCELISARRRVCISRDATQSSSITVGAVEVLTTMGNLVPCKFFLRGFEFFFIPKSSGIY